jgi:hypothetical protein
LRPIATPIALKPIWRPLIVMARRSLAIEARMLATTHARRIVHPIARAVLPRLLLPAPAGRSVKGDAESVRVVGLLSSASGLGNSARLCVDQLAASGFSVTTVDVAPFLGASDEIGYRLSAGDAAAQAISIHHLNPPKLLPGIIRAGLRQYYRS